MMNRSSKSASVCTLLTGACIGAIAMYFLDPQTGRRRRALVRDQVTHAAHALVESQQTRARDLANRASGLWSKSTNWLRSHDDSDEAVNARLRSRLGRLAASPHAIESSVENGRAVLRGSVRPSEVERVIDEIRRVPGVREVVNLLSVEEQPQGGRSPAESQRQSSGFIGEPR